MTLLSSDNLEDVGWHAIDVSPFLEKIRDPFCSNIVQGIVTWYHFPPWQRRPDLSNLKLSHPPSRVRTIHAAHHSRDRKSENFSQPTPYHSSFSQYQPPLRPRMHARPNRRHLAALHTFKSDRHSQHVQIHRPPALANSTCQTSEVTSKVPEPKGLEDNWSGFQHLWICR